MKLSDIGMTIKKKHLLVTGGAGFIGRHFLLGIDTQKYDVTVLDDLSRGERGVVPDGMVFLEGNCGDRSLLRDIFSGNEVFAIFHFASSISPHEASTNPAKYFSNNTVNTFNLVDEASRASVGYFIFSSTAAVYGESDEKRISEISETNVTNAYGLSKLLAEKIIRNISSNLGFKYAVLRYFNVAGADPEMRAGPTAKPATHLINVLAEVVAGKRDHIELNGSDYSTKDGTCVRDYIHVTDLTNAHWAALDHLINDENESFTANLGYGHGVSVLEAIRCCERVSQKLLCTVKRPRRPGDVPSLVADGSKFASLTGWQPAFDDLEKILTHSIQWENQNN